MNNLQITLYMKTPIIFGRYEINLDSLLYWSAYEGSNENHDAAMQIVDKALGKKDGVYLSSNAICLQSPHASIKQTTVCFPTCFNWQDFGLPINKKSIMELGGPYRARLTKYDAIETQAIKFYATGDKDMIEFLLSSIGGIGRGNNQGNGEVSEIVINVITDDFSWYQKKDNAVILHRNLPENIVDKNPTLKEATKKKGLSQIKIELPYTTSQSVRGYETGFLRELQLTI